MKIVTWQIVLTEHQVHVLKALQELAGEPIRYVIGERHLEERRAQGWKETPLEDLSVHTLRRRGWWKQSRGILNAHRGAVHIFCGLWGDRRFLPILWHAQRMGVATAVMTEPFADVAVSYSGARAGLADRFRQIVRPVAYRLAAKLTAGKMAAVFAISDKAVRQFRDLGFKADRIFPFGYFIPAQPAQERTAPASHPDAVPRLVFIGNLIERKGLPVLLDAVTSVNRDGSRLRLDIYGPNSQNVSHAIPAGTSIKGPIEFGSAQEVLRTYDLLILPSLFDGWGVVVNEALLQSVPAVVSDAAGARALVEASGAGEIFPSGNAEALARILDDIVRRPDRLAAWRVAAGNFSGALKPETAALYLYESLRYALGESTGRPRAPWSPE